MKIFKTLLVSFVGASIVFATEIKFEAIEYFVPDSRVVISADIEDEVGISEARVYFKSIDSKIYPYAKMSCKASKCSATLPMSDSDTKTFNYIIMFQNNKGEVFKTKIFEVSKRDMIELPSWQTFDKSPLEIKSELFLTPKEILGFSDDFVITPVKDREKYGVVAKIVSMQNAGIKKLDEIPSAIYVGEISESGIDRGIEESVFTTKNMLIGGGILAGIMTLSSSSKKSEAPKLTPEGIETNSYELSSSLEAPLIAPNEIISTEIPTETPTVNEIPTVPLTTDLVPSGSDYELSANLDTPLLEPTTELLTTTTTKSVDTTSLLESYPSATLPTQTQKSITTPPEPTLETEVTTLPPTPTITPEPTPTPTSDVSVVSTDTSLIPSDNSNVNIVTTSDGANSITITTTVTTTIMTTPTYETTTVPESITTDTIRDNVRSCNENIISSRSYNESFQIDMKQLSGSTKLSYNMFNSKDRILVYYENSLIYESGCVAFDGSELNDNNKRSPKSLNFNGESSYISVEVSADCERSGQIDWSFTLSCP